MSRKKRNKNKKAIQAMGETQNAIAIAAAAELLKPFFCAVMGTTPQQTDESAQETESRSYCFDRILRELKKDSEALLAQRDKWSRASFVALNIEGKTNVQHTGKPEFVICAIKGNDKKEVYRESVAPYHFTTEDLLAHDWRLYTFDFDQNRIVEVNPT